MAILTREALAESLRTFIGDRQDDDAIALVENVTDTLEDAETRAKDQTDWRKKYEENDSAWRAKYRERFFSSGDGKEEEEGNNEDKGKGKKIISYDDLFEEVK